MDFFAEVISIPIEIQSKLRSSTSIELGNSFFTFGLLSAAYVVYYFTSSLISRYWKVTNVAMFMDDDKESWAVVTGASQGIGKEFALQLAEIGYSLVIIARSRDNLNKVQELILSKYSVQVIVYPFDFSKFDSANFESLKVVIHDINPCILINNVGICTEMPTSFLDTDPAFTRKMIQVNIGNRQSFILGAALEMANILLPLFDRKKKGLVVNVGSAYGTYSSGYFATYGGTKAFLKNWSLGLEMETCSGIKVHYLNTLWVATQMSKIRPSLFFPTPAKYVKSVLGLLGSAKVVITPYFWHFLIHWMIHVMPESFRLDQMNQFAVQLRARALAKRKRNE